MGTCEVKFNEARLCCGTHVDGRRPGGCSCLFCPSCLKDGRSIVDPSSLLEYQYCARGIT